MKYLLLIYADESQMVHASPEQIEATIAAYNAYGTALNEAGAYVAGAALQPTTMATTIRVRDGKTLTTDGPFAETHEQLGGFYLLDCKDLDEALDWASKLPAAPFGSIEVRPIAIY